MIYNYVKRFLDIIFSVLLFVILLPLFIVISFFVLLDSKGPIFFVQKRIGRNGRIFNIYKFRTMFLNSSVKKSDLSPFNEASFPAFKIKKDPRFTKVGYKLSRSGLDELPQLLNVFLGDMSFIGFRPPILGEVLQYTSCQKKRLKGVPGIISLWVVKGGHKLSFDEWVNLDIYYFKNLSFLLDFKILFKFSKMFFSRIFQKRLFK